jgi:hypothetical protein
MTNTAQAIRTQNDLHPCVPLVLPDATGLSASVVASAKAVEAGSSPEEGAGGRACLTLPSSSTSAAALL